MIWWFYNVLFPVCYVLLLPRFLVRMWKRGGYRKGFAQRFARYPDDIVERLNEMPRIWIHAVSVGEVYVALRFAEELRQSDPETAFVLTTTTSTGHRVAERRMDPRDVLLYFPADFPAVAARALSALKPKALILTECELWPNLIREAHSRGIPVIMINGRISQSSYRGYRLLRAFFRRTVGAMDLLLVQTPVDKQRLLSLGAPQSRVRIVGTAKYDIAQRESDGEETVRALLTRLGMGQGSVVVVGGSTWSGEEEALLGICGRLRSSVDNLKLVLAPRHAERRSQVESEIRKHAVTYLRRSELQDEPGSARPVDVLLVDTTGELKHFYACADVIFVGKSLTNHGGQNIIEPAMFGKPVIVGPNMENFPDVIEDFLAADGIVQVADANGLERELKRLLLDADARAGYGNRAAEVVRERRGSVAASARMIRKCLNRDRNASGSTEGSAATPGTAA